MRAAVVLALALGLNACSRAPHVSESLTGPVGVGATEALASGIQHTGSGEYAPSMPCPGLIGSTPDAPVKYVPSSGLVASFRSNRFRIETMGEMAGPSLEDMGPCAATADPTIRFIGGHANVFLHGTQQSITFNAQPITFGQLQFPVGLEEGIVLTTDAQNNVMEIIWPTLAGVGAGGSIVRVQLARWNPLLVSNAMTYDIVWDMTAEENGIQMFFTGHADNLGLDGLAVQQEGANDPPVCPQTLAGTDDAVTPLFASIVQFRANRLRLELSGDTPLGIIGASGPCAAAAPAGINYVGATANLFRAGTLTSVTATGQPVTFGQLAFPLALEPGVVLITDASNNLFEIIWPSLAGLPPGPPIIRLQLSAWNSWVRTGQKVDVAMRITGMTSDGIPATYTADATNIAVPFIK